MAIPADAQTTALYLESQPGDYVGAGQTQTFLPGAGTFTVSATTAYVSMTFSAAGSGPTWQAAFWTANQASALVAATTYYELSASLNRTSPGLAVSGESRGCSSSGRFLIREIAFNAAGTLTSFAADFEQHCNDVDPALFGAVRYNSSVSSLVPFDGDYPAYRLMIARPAHGTIAGGGLACAAAQDPCTVSFGAPTTVALTATPDPGYSFMSWDGSCSGGGATTGGTASIRVNQPTQCAAVFQAGSPGVTGLFMDSQAGDWIGQGQKWQFDPSNATFVLSPQNMQTVVFQINGSTSWTLEFDAPQGAVLAAGTYSDLTPFPPSSTAPWMNIGGNGRGCTPLGRFVVLELVRNADGTIQRFAADFEAHCGDPGLFGALRYNSTITTMVPFNGAYPVYQLTITPSTGGVVTGGGLSCGDTQTACVVAFPSVTVVTLIATPDPGFSFAGWSGSCAFLPQQAAIQVHVNRVQGCGAIFQAGPPTVTALYLESQTGDWVGAGQTHTYGVNGATYSVVADATQVTVNVVAWDNSFDWHVTLAAPRGVALSAGAYPSALGFINNSNPSMAVNGEGRGCTAAGRFTVREIAFGANGSLQRFAADFEQHCGEADPALFGAIRFNSTVTTLTPFDGAYPVYQLTVIPAPGGIVTGGTGGQIACGLTQTACTQTLSGPADAVLLATPASGYAFIGWGGACAGLLQQAGLHIRVNGPRQCQAQFGPGPASVTTLYLESETGDPVGGGTTRTYAVADANYFFSLTGSSLTGSVRAFGSNDAWFFSFSAPLGQPLAVAAYSPVTGTPSPASASMNISGNGIGCNTVSGRFSVRELVLASDGSLSRLAVDFEQHCDGSDAALFGAIRYNSLVTSVVPFNGVRTYQLTIVRGAHGTVSGGAINCGSGGTACVEMLGAPGDVSLVATPDRGYALRGWSGDCRGGRVTVVHVDRRVLCTPLFVQPAAPLDVDGDRLSDVIVWRPSDGTWYWKTSSSGFSDAGARARQWGSAALGDTPLLGDIDGDGVQDLIVWRASTGTWYWLLSSRGYDYAYAGSIQWGNQSLGDVPLVGDMDGDGLADLIVWRRSTGTFYWLTSMTGYSYASAQGIQWGNDALGDQPVLGDFDGDGLLDLGIWRASSGTWYWLTSSTNYSYASASGIQWGSGSQNDRVMAADIDGDGKADLIVWRPAEGMWYCLTSSTNYAYANALAKQWGNGTLGDVPFVADFDGDGKADFGIWRRSTGTWYWLTSSSGYDYGSASGRQWGAATDTPIVK